MRAWTLCLLLALTGCGTLGEKRAMHKLELDLDELTFAEALAHYGQGLLDEGENGIASAKAMEEFSIAAELDPSSLRLHSMVAVKALLRGEPEKAISELKLACEANPESVKAWLDLARTCQAAKHLDDALRYYRRALKLSPGNEQILGAIVAVLFDQQEDKAALKVVRRAISRKGKDSVLAALCHNFGRQFIVTGQPDRAIPCFELLTQQLPRNTHQYDYLLGELYRAGKNNRAAIRWYRRATMHKDPMPEAFVKLALLELESDNDRAVEALERGARRLPDSTMVLLTLASLYVQSGRVQEAIPLYKRVYELPPDSERGEHKPAFYLHYGAACERAGNSKKAADIFLEGLEKYPDEANILNYLAYMWAEEEINLDRALEYALRALKIEPDSGAYLDTLGWIYHKQGRNGKALESIQKARALMEEDATINEHLGDVLLAMDNPEEALVYWKKSFLLNPDNEALEAKLGAYSINLKALRKQAEKATR